MSDRLHKILINVLDLKGTQIIDDALLVEDLGADSLNVVEIVIEVETEFDIEIDDYDVENVKTVGQLKQLISDLV
jgi:acyl carrier protein